MYKELLNENVTVVVSTRSDMMLEYNGVLVNETSDTIIMNNVSINQVTLNFQKNVFGSGMSIYKTNIDKIIINKDYVISCNKY